MDEIIIFGTWKLPKVKPIESEKKLGLSVAKDLGQHRVGQVFVVPSFLFSCHAITTTKTRRLEPILG